MFTARISSVARVALRVSSTAPCTLSLKKNALLIPAVRSRYTNSIRLFNASSLRLNDKPEATTAPTTAEEEVRADHSSVDSLASTESSESTPSSSSSSGEVYIDPLQAQADATANDGAAAPEAPAQIPDPVEVASRTVFAGGLSWNVDVDWLRDEVATAIGSTDGIVSCRVARDSTGRSKGFGFIELTTVEHAQKLVEVSPVIDERETRFEISDPSTKKERPARERRSSDQYQSGSPAFGQQENPPSNSVWLGNLEWSTTEADLREAFDRFGEIGRVHMPLDRMTQRSRGIAYIDYANVSQAEDAIAAAQNIEINGRYIRANFATRQAPFSRANGGGNRGGFNRRDGGESGSRSSYGSRGDRNDRYGDRQSSYQSRQGMSGRDEGW